MNEVVHTVLLIVACFPLALILNPNIWIVSMNTERRLEKFQIIALIMQVLAAVLLLGYTITINFLIK